MFVRKDVFFKITKLNVKFALGPFCLCIKFTVGHHFSVADQFMRIAIMIFVPALICASDALTQRLQLFMKERSNEPRLQVGH